MAEDKPKKKVASKVQEPSPKKAKKQKKAGERGAQEVFELVRIRNYFYRDSYRKLIVLLLLMLTIIVILSSIIYYMYTHRPAPKYFATNIQGQLIELQPLNLPSVSDGELLNWATRGVAAAFTINYVEWRSQLQFAQDTYFTTSGAEAYLQALGAAKTLDTIREGQLIATARATRAPVILNKGVLQQGRYQNRFYWDVQLPVSMTLQNPATKLRVNMDIQLRIIRSSAFVDSKAVNLDGAQGIGIDRFLARDARASSSSVAS